MLKFLTKRRFNCTDYTMFITALQFDDWKIAFTIIVAGALLSSFLEHSAGEY